MDAPSATQSSIIPASNEMVTLTLPALPSSRESFLKLALPFGVGVQPFKTTTPPPIVSFPSNSINRCDYCRAFINPYVEWQIPGSRYICSLCGHSNYLKTSYQMFNVGQYPELTTECVDITVPINYQQSDSEYQHIVFLIDLNCPCIDYIIQCIEAMEIYTKVALIGYDNSVHLYKAFPSSICENIIMPDVDVDICDSSSTFFSKEALLKALQFLKTTTTSPSNQLHSAITIAKSMLKCTGGKIVVINSTVVDSGIGKYQPRSEMLEKHCNSDFTKLSVELNSQGVTVDLHIVSSSFIDLAQIIDISSKTGGVCSYSNLNTLADGNFFTHLQTSFNDITGVDGSFRLRHSTNLRIVQRYGHFNLKMGDVISSPVSNTNTSITFRLTIESPIKSPNVYIQTSYLFTTPENSRYIRVCTKSIPVVQTITECIPKDFGPVSGLMMKILMDQRTNLKVDELTNSLKNQMAKILSNEKSAPKSVCYKSQIQTQFIPLALYAASIHQIISIPSNDFSVVLRDKILAMPLLQLYQFIFPRCYDAHSMEPIPTDATNLDHTVLLYDGFNWILSIGNKEQDIREELLGEERLTVITHSNGIMKNIREIIGEEKLIVCVQNTDEWYMIVNFRLFTTYQFDGFMSLVNSKLNN